MQLVIHNTIYEVQFVKSDDKHLLMEDNEYHSGVTDFINKTIYINKNLKNDNSISYTVMHELTHAMIDSYGFLQVDWNDEIIADFMALYSSKLYELAEKVEEQFSIEREEK